MEKACSLRGVEESAVFPTGVLSFSIEIYTHRLTAMDIAVWDLKGWQVYLCSIRHVCCLLSLWDMTELFPCILSIPIMNYFIVCFSLKMIFWVEGWGLYIDSACRPAAPKPCASVTTLVSF